jgi:hypothetical protein
MAKKTKKYAGKTDKEWRDLGEEFGKKMDKIAVRFSDRMERAGRNKSKKRKQVRNECCSSIMTPILGAVVQVFILAVGLWILKSINFLNLSLISNFYQIIMSNLHWFFAAFLIFGYDKYAKSQDNYWVISPMFKSLRVVFSLWMVTLLIELISMYTFNGALSFLSFFFYYNITRIFLMFLILLYVAAFIGKIIEVNKWHKK